MDSNGTHPEGAAALVVARPESAAAATPLREIDDPGRSGTAAPGELAAQFEQLQTEFGELQRQFAAGALDRARRVRFNKRAATLLRRLCESLPRYATLSVDEPGRAGRRHNLPLQPTELIGRDQELDVAKQLLQRDSVRLLTLTGPAGVGKTRLAFEVAGELLTSFPDGVWFVDLAPVRDPGQVGSAIARALGVTEDGQGPSPNRLEAGLADRRLLLVLDNFEQVAAAATQVAELLATFPGVKILVTSRTRLRLRWEHVLPVAPLACPCPEGGAPLTLEAAAAVPAVALFVERARASRPGFELTPDNLPAVAALCEQLEGLPLAIEMAAARANALAPGEMIGWVEQGLPALSWDAPDLPARQQRLGDALEWSYSRLAPPEQALFRRLAVFVGGCSLEAAAAVGQIEALGLDPRDGLAGLVDASLLQVSQSTDGESRFSLLETLRRFAFERLAASGDLEETRRRHADHFLALVTAAAPALERGPGQRAWFGRLEREHDNLRAALAWAAQHDEGELELRLASGLARFWRRHGNLREGRDWLADALTRGQDVPADLWREALQAAGLMAASMGEFGPATEQLEEALAVARALEDRHGTLEALSSLTYLASLQGQPERGLALKAEIAAARPGADRRCLSSALHCLGLAAHDAGEHGAAAGYLEEALALSRGADDPYSAAHRLGALAAVVQAQGDTARGADLAAESLKLARELGCPRAIAWCTRVTAPVSRQWVPADALAGVLAAADAMPPTLPPPLSPCQRARLDEVVAATRAALGESAFGAAWAAGRAMTPDEVVATQLAGLESRPPAAEAPPVVARPSRGAGPLSPREGEVLRLVADGLTNKQIAERLVISVATVNYHVGWVLNKLGAENRAQAVAVATHHGLL